MTVQNKRIIDCLRCHVSGSCGFERQSEKSQSMNSLESACQSFAKLGSTDEWICWKTFHCAELHDNSQSSSPPLHAMQSWLQWTWWNLDYKKMMQSWVNYSECDAILTTRTSCNLDYSECNAILTIRKWCNLDCSKCDAILTTTTWCNLDYGECGAILTIVTIMQSRLLWLH